MSAHNNNQSTQKRTSFPIKEAIKKKMFLLRSIPIYVVLLTAIPIGIANFYYYHYIKNQKSPQLSLTEQNSGDAANMKVIHESGLGLIEPVLFTDNENESYFSQVKAKINSYLEQKSRDGLMTSASVYIKDFETGFNLSINSDSLYDPASLMKVPLLMIYLKMAQKNPELMNKTYLFSKDTENSAVEQIKDKTLVPRNSYTVAQLLYYMIVYSDNEAFWLLGNNVDDSVLEALNKKFEIPGNYDILHYPKADKHFIANASSIARYFLVLYNSSYLDNDMSTYALNLLTKSTYKKGIVKGIDSTITVAHKFGEREISYISGGKLVNLQTEFHDFGIVYIKDRPYLIGVMTRGKDSNKLQQVVSDISKIVYGEMAAGRS